MCGIAGYYGPKRIGDDRAAACLKLMRHRGPDGSGTHRFEGFGRHLLLLHTRLSIIDLDERAAQPMARDGKVLSFNGELYNYLELRRDLERRGTAFATQSDTEVLLQALALDGEAALDAMEGMWALALYDQGDGLLTLCRDRFGEKPLFLLEADGGLYFASELRALFALAGGPPPVNRDQVLRYLVNGYKCLHKTEETFFQGVRELPAGELLGLGPDMVPRQARYWNPSGLPDESMEYSQAVAGARERLLRSVELRLRADVPLAFCMSGGVDSNTLIALASRLLGHDVHGFTVSNRDERYDEDEIVARAVEELGIRHTFVPMGRTGFMRELRGMVRQRAAPVATISYYAHFRLMQALSGAGYKVSISGTAADELFTGYYDHHSMYLASVHGTPRFETALAEWQRHIAPIVRNPLLQDPLAFVRDPGQRGHIYLDAGRFAARLRLPFSEPFAEAALHPELIRNRMLNELFHEAVPVILHEDDANAMSVSVENRSPFLDRNLFEFCAAIPTRHLVRDGFNKAVLRDACRDVVPAPVLASRRKVGFNCDLSELLDAGDPDIRAQILSDGPVFELVDREAVAGLLRPGPLPNSESKFLFSFLTSKFFLEEYGSNV